MFSWDAGMKFQQVFSGRSLDAAQHKMKGLLPTQHPAAEQGGCKKVAFCVHTNPKSLPVAKMQGIVCKVPLQEMDC